MTRASKTVIDEVERRKMIRGAGRAMVLCALGGPSLRAAAVESASSGEADDASDIDCGGLLSHRLRPLTGGESVALCERFSGQVLLIVNTASRCGFTPQFDDLETLHGRYAERGFRVLGFPSDEFRQELDDEAEVAAFCRLNYGVTFPMFQKVDVAGENAHPLFRDLAAEAGFPRWNFNKYLIDRDARVTARYDSSVLPLGERLVGDLESLL